MPPIEAWPYNYERDGWPPSNEPSGIDDLARRLRLNRYYRVNSLEECKFVLGYRKSAVQVSLDITDDWFSAPNGRIPFRNRNSRSVGAHCVLLTSYSDARGEFRFVNSWGEGWGDRGFGSIPYALFERTWNEGWALGSGAPVQPKPEHAITKAVWVLQEEKTGLVTHGATFVTREDDRFAWSFGYESNGHLWLEELFVKPSHRRRGFGKALMLWAARVCEKRNLELGALVSHVDAYDSASRGALSRVVSPYGLIIRETGVSWAPFVASIDPVVSGSPGLSAPPPSRPASPFVWGTGPR
jgi:GNAT superfamily N-acetyltransferase